MKLALDAMGGDNAPAEIVKGAIDAVKKYPCEIVLVGNETVITEILNETPDWKDFPITIKHADEVIEMNEHPADAVRNKKNSSIVVATQLVKSGECDAVLSAGSTGAAVTAAQLISPQSLRLFRRLKVWRFYLTAAQMLTASPNTLYKAELWALFTANTF